MKKPARNQVTVTGTSGDDTLLGTAANDLLQGLGGNDILDGRAGIDTTDGGTGDDWHYVDNAGDVVLEAVGGGTDRVFASVSYTLGAGVEVEIMSTDFHGGFEVINLTGNELANTIYGNAGFNQLNGGAGADTLIGRRGNDSYFVDNAGDRVFEAAGEGNDRVFVSLSYTLMAGAEIEIMSTDFNAGTAAIDLTGNEFRNIIYGNDGDNRLDGGAGPDTLVGRAGNDWYFVDHSDVIVETAGGGSDRVFASESFILTAGAEVEILSTDWHAGTSADNLFGNELANTIYGNDGDNFLWGEAGADTLIGFGGRDVLIGGEGNDTFFVADAEDAVNEDIGQGNDRVFASVSYTLAAGAEVELMATAFHAGTAAIDLTGNAFANIIHGNDGDNRLDGRAGADTLVGRAGNDWYYVDNAGDRIVEAAGEGNDRVFASVSYTLAAGAEVEVLTTDLHIGTAAINLTGNALANAIHGNDGDNRLNGGAGADTLGGRAGNDWFFVDNAGDLIVETVGEGNDRVFASASYTLTAGAEVELMTTDVHAGTAAIDLTGNEFSQAIYGNAGNNILDGGAGKDVLIGNGGADIFLFSTVLNTAPGTAFAALAATANVDQIQGFAFDDKIGLDAARFGLTPGALPASAFVTGTAAQDANDRIIYDSATGALLFDSDGTGAAAAQLFAYISGPFSLDATYFVVI